MKHTFRRKEMHPNNKEMHEARFSSIIKRNARP